MLMAHALEMVNLMRGLDTESDLETIMNLTSLRLYLVTSIPIKSQKSRLPLLLLKLQLERTSGAYKFLQTASTYITVLPTGFTNGEKMDG